MCAQDQYRPAEADRKVVVLVVDDEPDIRKTLKLGLPKYWERVCGIERSLVVEAAGSVEEAKQLLETMHFACALVDIELGVGGSSSEVCSVLSRHGIPLLRMSGNYEALESLPIDEQGLARFRKPFQLDDVTTAIRQHMRVSF